MKITYQFFAPLFLSMVLLYSCGSSKSFNQKNIDYVNDTEINNGQSINQNTPTTDSENNKKETSNFAEVEQNSSTISANAETIFASEEQAVHDGTDRIEGQKESVTNTSTDPNYSKRSFEKKESKFKLLKTAALVKNKIKKGKEKLTSYVREGDALSLLWIIILILLILWVFGWVFGGFGLGGLIHVLAVIALILLILWLLRII